MKKTVSGILILSLALCLAACGSPAKSAPSEAAPAPPPSTVQPPVSEAAASELPESEAAEEAPSSEAPAPTGDFNSWNELVVEYNDRIMNDTSDFTSDPNVGMAALSLLAGEIELAYTTAFFQPGAESAVTIALGIFSLTDVQYTESEDSATAEAVNSRGQPVKFEVHYGGGNTAVMNYYLDGALLSELSFCVTDGYAAKMYKEFDESSPQTICAIVRPNGDVWMGIDNKVLEGTLFQNSAAAEDPAFAEGLPEHYSYVGGVLTKS